MMLRCDPQQRVHTAAEMNLNICQVAGATWPGWHTSFPLSGVKKCTEYHAENQQRLHSAAPHTDLHADP
jgi:hypothetical protein